MGFVNRNNGIGSFCDSRVQREYSLECFSINVYSHGSKEIQKQSVNMIENRKKKSHITMLDDYTTPVGSPDIDIEMH